MAFCADCGAEVQGKFCAKCGSPMASAGGGAAPPPAPPQGTAPPQTPWVQPASAGMTDNVASALCYVLGLITGILFLVLAPYSQNRAIRFHAWQSIFLHIGTIALVIALMIVGAILNSIPILGVLLSIVLSSLLWLGVFVLWVMLIYKAYNNERWVLPIIGELAEKQA